MKHPIVWILTVSCAIWVISHLYLYFAYPDEYTAYKNELLRNQVKETVALIGRSEDLLNNTGLFIGKPDSLTFNAENVFITVSPNQKIHIISTTTVTNQVYP